MATTGTLVAELVNGLRDSSGAVVASGKVRFYQPGTLVAETVYSDSACASAITQPLTLDAGGRYTVYMKNPVRMIAKDSTDTTTLLDTPILARAEQIYITNTNINGGAETTVNAVLSDAATSFGSGFLYRQSSGATARTFVSVIGERCVSVKDFGATGDGSTDDTTAVQNAISQVASLGGGIVLFPYGTYAITGVSITNVGVCLQGTGRLSVIKNTSTSASAITINVGSAIDCKAFIRDLAITASTTSSGKGILLTNGDRMLIDDVAVSLHRTGIDHSAVSFTKVRDCVIVSTDGNAAGIGIKTGTSSITSNCQVHETTTNGTGITLNGSPCLVTGCTVAACSVGFAFTNSQARAINCTSIGSTTGATISGSANNCEIIGFNGGKPIAITGSTGCLVQSCFSGTISADSTSDRTRIIGNSLAASSDITLSTADYCVVQGNTIVSGQITDGGVGNVISGNTVAKSGGTAIATTGTGAIVMNNHVYSSTTGIAATSGSGVISGNTFRNTTTGISASNQDSWSIIGNLGGNTNTTDIALGTSTKVSLQGNVVESITGGVSTPGSGFLAGITNTTDATSTPNWTPTTPIAGAVNPQILHCTYAVGTKSVTVGNPSSTNRSVGTILWIVISNEGANNVSSITFGSDYKRADSSGTPNSQTVGNQAQVSYMFRYDGTYWVQVLGALAF